jgi:hypothetical protein
VREAKLKKATITSFWSYVDSRPKMVITVTMGHEYKKETVWGKQGEEGERRGGCLGMT